MTDARIQAELRRIYDQVDRWIARAGPRCRQSGVCCDFPRSDLTLFATRLEVAHILETTRPEPPEQKDWCPFYRQGQCTLRTLRPLGCRIYFCDATYQAGAMTDIAENAHRALIQLHDAWGIPYRYAPFLDLLEEGDGISP